VRPTTLGRKACILNVQTSDYWHANPKTQWHRVIIFTDKLVDIAERNLRKGSKVYVEGRLETRKWRDKNGETESWTVEVVLSGFDGRLTLLDDRPQDRDELAEPAELPPTMMAAKRSSKHGAGAEAAPESDKIDSGLSFLT